MKDDLNKELERLLQKLKKIMQDSYLASLKLPQIRKALSSDKPFWLASNYTARKEIDKIINDFSNQANHLFVNSINRSWALGEENAHQKVQLMLNESVRNRKLLDEIRVQAIQQQRNISKAASIQRFITEKRGGASLSGRVWKLGDGMKKEIEVMVQNAIKEGKSPEQLANGLKDFLKEPDRLYRRVRNKETGKLELSEAAKKYKPGRGVYRSAFKNAMRLARTEIPASYRRAAWEKYQPDPMVTGIHIKLSNNHTTLINGVPTPFVDICDDLEGIYPKTFLWTGWHPQCRCDMFPVIATPKELRKMMDAKLENKTYTPQQVETTPEGFGDWIDENIDRASNSTNIPYWMNDNRVFIDAVL